MGRRTVSRSAVIGAAAALVIAIIVAGAAFIVTSRHSGPDQTAGTAGSPAPVAVPTVLILDASGSMNETDAPGPRIDAAKTAAQALVDGLPEDATLGLTTYGTGTGSTDAEQAAGCADVITLIPLSRLDRDPLRSAISGLRASGYTPISLALRTAVAQLPADDSAQAIVLVSDGEDTCGAPPCDEARQAKLTHPGLAISTVGFKTEGAASDQLNCIATSTGGLFVQAQNANQLVARLLATQNVAIAQSSLSSNGFAGITLGTKLADIRAAHPDFPDAATSGSATVIYRDCDFGFLDGVLDSIAPHGGGRTIDGVGPGTPISRATELYGSPLGSVQNSDGTHSVLYTADPNTDAAYRILVDRYTESSGTISGQVKTIVLCRCKPKTGVSGSRAEQGITFGGYADALGGMSVGQIAALGWTFGPSGGGDGCTDYSATRGGVELSLTGTAPTDVVDTVRVTSLDGDVPLTARLPSMQATYSQIKDAYPDADMTFEPPKPGPTSGPYLYVMSKANPDLGIRFSAVDATHLDDGSMLIAAVGGTREGLHGSFGCAH
jgi:Ca-activated chloride channel family protein